jgi:transposase
MYNKSKIPPIVIVRYYLQHKTSLRKTADRFNIHYQTLYKWVKYYKSNKYDNLRSNYRNPWNRTSKEIEEEIVLMKEKNPLLTVRETKTKLQQKGTDLSIKTIWSIWKRYGYTGTTKRRLPDIYSRSTEWSEEAKINYEHVKYFVESRKIADAAHVLNTIPFVPRNVLIQEMPDRFLNYRRKVEKVSSLFGSIPNSIYISKLQSLMDELKRKGLYFFALRVGVLLLNAQGWNPELVEELKRMKEGKG